MTNEYNLKEGDKVTLKDDTTSVGVVRFVGKESCIVDFGLGDSTTDYKDIVPLDRRTDFLRRLGALLREFDARIYDGELYAIHIELGYHSPKSEQVDYLFYKSDNYEINADNIMDFEKV